MKPDFSAVAMRLAASGLLRRLLDDFGGGMFFLRQGQALAAVKRAVRELTAALACPPAAIPVAIKTGRREPGSAARPVDRGRHV